MSQIAIIAGEASGDANGAALAIELRRLHSGLTIWGAGGPRMKAAGVELVADLSSFGAIGVVQSLKVVPRLLREFNQVKRQVLARRPDVVVPIDFGAFNIKLADDVKDAGLKVVYYFPPSSWRRKPKDPALLYQATDVVITPFPWSEELLRRANIDARFVGHPLLDLAKPELSREEFRASLKGQTIIGMLPGSRSHEIRHILPALLGVYALLRRSESALAVCIAAAPGTGDLVRTITESVMRRLGISAPPIEEGRTYDVIAHSDLIITCSGTATLEAAILGTPMVIVYKGSGLMKLEYLFRRGILEGGFAGMPNIVAQKEICPELLGDDATPERIAAAALDLLRSSDKLDSMKEGLANVRDILGAPGATERAARIVLETGGIA